MTGCQDDHSLVAACRAGQTEAFGVLVRRYQDRLFPTIVRLVGSAEDAQDVLQDAFVRGFEKLDQFHGVSSIYTWIYRIAINLALSGHRKSRNRRFSRLNQPGRNQPVADHIGQPAEQQVASLVERTTHRDYFKITVSQGIVIDPRHPGKATVFAVVLDENELGPFRDRLQEDDVNPAVAMQLADIGQVVSFPAHPIGDLTIPRSNLALRAPELGEPKDLDPALAAAAAEIDEPKAEQARSSPAAALDRSAAIKQRAGGAVASSREPGGKVAGAPAHAPAADDDRLAHDGNSRDPRPAAAAAPVQGGTARGLPRSDERHLIVLVWIAGTSSG